MGQGLFHGRCFCADGLFDALSTQWRKGTVVLRFSILRRTLMSAGEKEGVGTIQ
jgi:hypothetical protein